MPDILSRSWLSPVLPRAAAYFCFGLLAVNQGSDANASSESTTAFFNPLPERPLLDVERA